MRINIVVDDINRLPNSTKPHLFGRVIEAHDDVDFPYNKVLDVLHVLFGFNIVVSFNIQMS